MKIKFHCSIHGDYYKRKDRIHEECPKCVWLKQTKTKETFIQEARQIHNDIYDYSKVDYKGARVNVIIICKEHGHFLQTPDNHNSKNQGCPKCKMFSKGEHLIEQYLKEHKVNFIPQKRFDDCRGKVKPLPFDFYLPKYNTCIEYDGKQHYLKESKFYSTDLIKNDKIKDEYCSKNNIRLVRIPYWKKQDLFDFFKFL